jgi:hypothetical protein
VRDDEEISEESAPRSEVWKARIARVKTNSRFLTPEGVRNDRLGFLSTIDTALLAAHYSCEPARKTAHQREEEAHAIHNRHHDYLLFAAG